MANKTLGKGGSLELSISSSFTAIAQVTKVHAPRKKMGQVETTDLGSTSRTFLATILDSGEVSFSINYDPDDSTHAQLNTSCDAGTMEAWKVKMPATPASIFAFSGFITEFSPGDMTVDGLQTADLTIKVSGAVTITP